MSALFQNDDLEIVITGGTLDKDYHSLSGDLVFPKQGQPSHVAAILQQANVAARDGQLSPIKLTHLLQIDSLQMKKKHRLLIAETIRQSLAQKLVVTHGTDTMVKTAKKLLELMRLEAKFSALNKKTIVLTGAMRPFALGNSDASFNLGAALIAAQTLPAGVYICMNGNLHHGDEVVKDYQKGLFVTLDTQTKSN